jgi:hypothetical protein
VNEQPSFLTLSMSHMFRWAPGASLENRPLPRGEGGAPSRCTSSGGGPGLRPPKGYWRPARTARCGPQAGEGSVTQQSHLLGSWVEGDYN